MKQKTFTSAFTIVELIIVIVVIAILATLTAVGVGQWREHVAETEVKSDLLNTQAGMEDARNRNDGYPVFSEGTIFNGSNDTKDIFTQSEFVTITYIRGTATEYCVDVRSKAKPGIYMFLDTSSGNKTPQVGTCDGGLGATPPSPDQTVFVFDTTAPGCTGTVQLPVSQPATGGTVDWGDGTVQARSGSLMTYVYGEPGRYTVKYSGPLNEASYYYWVNSTYAKCLVRVNQWANDATPTRVSFSRASNLVYVAEPPHTTTDMVGMFEYTDSFNQPIGHWDVSNVTNMHYMFMRASSFNQPLNDWDMSNVKITRYMFLGTPFNQPLDDWDMSNVGNISGMFMLSPFNQPIGNWDVSNVKYMEQVFCANEVFNQDISDWDVSNVTTMNSMFYGSYAFNQDISDWDVSSVTNMSTMLLAAHAFNQPIGKWDVSNVTTMYGMMQMMYAFNQPLNDWDVSNVTSMMGMFYAMYNFNQPLNNWDTSNVEGSLNSMFYAASKFNQPLNSWNTSKIDNFTAMFKYASAFNQDISGWNTSSMTVGTDFRVGSPLITDYTPPALR